MDEKKARYWIVEEIGAAFVINQVQKMIDLGYGPQGGLAYNSRNHSYAQAMVLQEKEAERVEEEELKITVHKLATALGTHNVV